jgi:hypothetical protein
MITSSLVWDKTQWVVHVADLDRDLCIAVPLREWLNLKMVQYAIELADDPAVERHYAKV